MHDFLLFWAAFGNTSSSKRWIDKSSFNLPSIRYFVSLTSIRCSKATWSANDQTRPHCRYYGHGGCSLIVSVEKKGEERVKREEQGLQAMMEFHISKGARERYGVEETLFSFNGNVIFADAAASRRLAHQMNTVRQSSDHPELVVNPGALFAMGLLDEMTHVLFAQYREEIDPLVITDALQWFKEKLGAESLDELLLTFVENFPGSEVHRGKVPADEWLAGSTNDYPNRHSAFEELVLLWLANKNAAYRPFQELFDEANLKPITAYEALTSQLRDYFDTRPPAAPEFPNLLDMMSAPALASPDSLSDQLEYVRRKWTSRVGEVMRRLMLATDVLKEEDVAIWMRFHPPSAAAEAARRKRDQDNAPRDHRGEVLEFGGQQNEYEHFSPDQDWMPNTVLIAKSTYVWLDQLSKRYKRHVHRLDQIPDEELASLAHRGFNALWLIGVWERSKASQTIKRLCGNAEAVASAYSLYDYSIATDLGGEEAYRNLRDRSQAHGIRLASDMVPNHMGIDSRWVIEHPEWFLSRDDSPYPAYRFDGPDLSNDDRIEIKIEDHYFEQSDAAVVFRRRDKWTGSAQFVYHGNDGTSFPWNDTAQLNYLSAQVREQVIQTILHVARSFPIIRFDAAMTLAKRHIQRLWFPVPGTGGAIPSRAESSMTPAEFDAAIPHEFWREVVDRVAVEVPGTLLLAEAFWLMEGYFVRTLGMHRVYNSAFMVMMRDEDNAKYRSVLKNTMEFDPGIMKRYVNFMSNPDERTAIDQFGSGDKFFGVASLMATLPGLPMFGHGQVEGFTEKYGMEYYRPRYDETPNDWLVERHQREIAPLLHQRKLFAESDHFLLYDLWRPDGIVDENVFAYSNRSGDQRALVLFNNNYGSTSGTIHHSTNFADKATGSLRQLELHVGLGLPTNGDLFIGYRDVSGGLEYIRRASELAANGFTINLRGYQYCVLLQWRELRSDAHHPWADLHDQLRGEGVPNLEEAFVDLQMKPVHDAVYALLEPSLMRALVEASKLATASQTVEPSLKEVEAPVEAPAGADKATALNPDQVTEQLVKRTLSLFEASSRVLGVGSALTDTGKSTAPRAERSLQSSYKAIVDLLRAEATLRSPWPDAARQVLPSVIPGSSEEGAGVAPVVAVQAIRWLLPLLETSAGSQPLDGFEALHLRKVMAKAFRMLQIDGEDSWRWAARVKLLVQPPPSIVKATKNKVLTTLTDWMGHDPDVRWLAGVHESDAINYFVKEPFEQLLWWLHLPLLLEGTADAASAPAMKSVSDEVAAGLAVAEKAGYRLGRLEEAVLPPRSVQTEEVLPGASDSPAQGGGGKATPAAKESTVVKAVAKEDQHVPLAEVALTPVESKAPPVAAAKAAAPATDGGTPVEAIKKELTGKSKKPATPAKSAKGVASTPRSPKKKK